MIGRLWFAPFNGSGAVTFFFVLSGFVLPWRFFHSGNLSTISTGLLKRWPRLAGPCVIVTILSWLLFRLGAYHFAVAGAVTASPWLQTFAYAGLPSGTYPDAVTAALQGAFTTFFSGNASLDSSLWTMRPEIVGSIVVFGMAPILHYLRSTWACLSVTVVVATLLWGAEPHVPQFMAGMLLARLLVDRSWRIPLWGSVLLVVVAFYLFSFFGPRGDYAWLAFTGLTDPQSFWMMWTPAAVMLILATLSSPPANRVVSGRLGVLLGRLSFPLYLVHVPIFCSAGAWVYVVLWPMTGARVAAGATVITVLVVSVLAAFALSRFDGWWVGQISRVVNRAIAARR